jgi:hypothetical protein
MDQRFGASRETGSTEEDYEEASYLTRTVSEPFLLLSVNLVIQVL